MKSIGRETAAFNRRRAKLPIHTNEGGFRDEATKAKNKAKKRRKKR